MERAEAIGFIRHAKIMLGNASEKIKEEWDNPDVSLSPAQTSEMRRELQECSELLKKIDPYAKQFESVSRVRNIAVVP